MTWHGIIHLGIGVTWGALVVTGAIGLTMLGSEEHRISSRRGALRQEQAQIERQLQQTSAALEVATTRPRIDVAVRVLGLPLQRTVEVASR